jgi:hypothetical protein
MRQTTRDTEAVPDSSWSSRARSVFLFVRALHVCYLVSGVLVKPDWKEAAMYRVMLEAG